jgi:hypothetical protein
VTLPPYATGFGEPYFVTCTSTCAAVTVLVALAELFAELESAWSAVTLADAVIEPAELGITTTVAVAWLPLFTDPKLQVTTPLAWEHEPALGIADR